MTITRVGTNQKYSEGWDKAFAGKKTAKPAAANAAGKKKAPSKKAAKKGKK